MNRTKMDNLEQVLEKIKPISPFDSPTFERDVRIRVGETVGAASISPSGRDVVLASREGLHIIDLDSPYSPPRHLTHYSPWEVADVQWSPFAIRDTWIVSTSNQKALVWNLGLVTNRAPIEYILHAHSRAITDINFSAYHPDILATCAVDSYVHCWDLRRPARPAMTFADWNAGATQVKWNRQDEHIIASSHDKFLRIWDDRKGAIPLKSIEAHTTKIYGVDWNRTRRTAVLTCSLDKTIKFWDFSREDDEPERVIRTLFPVWRARHTPFGWGVLAMPQRGNYDLHLYDRRLGEESSRDGHVRPVHSFEGHNDQVKEFLWRSRGDIEHGIDNRDFQLISWGMDRDLLLHRMDPKYLLAVGYEKGKEVQKRLNLTRKGAVYKSFRDENPPTQSDNQDDIQDKDRRPHGLGALVSAAGMSKAQLAIGPFGVDAGFMTSSISMYGRRQMKRSTNPIKWMEGVKMGHRRESMLDPFLTAGAGNTLGHNSSWDTRESLSDEMTYVAKKYKKVNFEKADVHRRIATVTLHGPWALEGKPAFIRVNFEFPDGYPTSAAAICTFERTTSSISEEVSNKLITEIQSIIDHYHSKRVGCLEALITYLLGERDLEQSISLPTANIIDEQADESSSDEDPVGDEAQDLDTSATDTLGLGSAQIPNVPLPKACGAYWSTDGRLICFFPPKPEPKPLFNLHILRSTDKGGKNHRQFEGFGRFGEESVNSKERMSAVTEEEETSSTNSWTSSSSPSSSDESDDITRLPSRFKPPSAWRAATLKFQKSSSHSSGGQAKSTAPTKPKSVISIHDFSYLLPAKKILAEQYQIFGRGPEICKHNADVASVNGMEELAAVWLLCQHILFDQVPLEIMDQSLRKEPILVLAKRNMVRVKRKDSAVDLQFDEPPSVSNPSLTGRVKWGRHPLASSWLICEIFDHFERAADIQMLAMLSCLFWEPAVREGVPNALMNFDSQNLPIAMKTPAFSLDYFPSCNVAWSLFQRRKGRDDLTTLVTMHQEYRSASWDYFNNRLGVYGSAGSSNGPWTGNLVPSEAVTSYSTNNTPPSQSRLSARNQTISGSLSTSPDFSHRRSKRSGSNISTTLASLHQSFPFTASSSPNDNYQVETSDLSTSAPSGGVTWGMTTVYSATSTTPSPEKRRRSFSRRRSSTIDSAYDLSDDEQQAPSFTEDTISTTQPRGKLSGTPAVHVKLKNQHLFDDDAYASTPLLDPQQVAKYAAYRNVYANQLSVWGLAIARAEILKFNGLTSYWAPSILNTEERQPYPRSGAQTRANEPRQSLLTMAAAQQQAKTKPVSISVNTSPKLEPTRMVSDEVNSITDLQRSSSQRLNPGAKPFVPQPNTLSQYQNNSTVPLPPSSLITSFDSSSGYSAKGSPGPPCVICWQPILGLACHCPSRNHISHAECLASLGELTGTGNGDEENLGCFCTGFPAMSSFGPSEERWEAQLFV